MNEDLDHRTLLRKYERELRRLRAELQQKSKDLVDKRLVLQVGGRMVQHAWESLAAGVHEAGGFSGAGVQMQGRGKECTSACARRLRRRGGGSRPTRLRPSMHLSGRGEWVLRARCRL